MDDKTIPLANQATTTQPPQPSPPSQPPQPLPPPPPQSIVQEPRITVEPPTQTPPPPPKPPSQETPLPHGPAFFDIFSFLPFIIGAIIIIVVVFVAIRVVPGLLPKKTTETVTLSYWGLWEEPNVMRAVLSDFEKEHPNIKVDYKKWEVKQYRETVSARIREGIGPDVFRFHNTWLPMFQDILSPIPQDVITPSQFSETFPKVVVEDLEEKGAIYGVPLDIDTLALFVNTDTFTRAGATIPKTWEDLQKVAFALTVKDEFGRIQRSGIALGTFDNVRHASDIISLLAYQNFGSLSESDLSNPRSKNAQDALCFYILFAKNQNPDPACNRGESFVWDETLDNSLLAFSKGTLAMYFGYSWDIFTIKVINPNLAFQVVPSPQLPNQSLNVASYWVEGVSKKSKHQKEAFELIKFLTRKETVQKLYTEEAKTRLFGAPYARGDLAETVKDDPFVSIFVNQAKTAVSTPFSSDTFDNGLNEELNTYLSDAVRKSLGNTSVRSSFETLVAGVAQTMEKYGIESKP